MSSLRLCPTQARRSRLRGVKELTRSHSEEAREASFFPGHLMHSNVPAGAGQLAATQLGPSQLDLPPYLPWHGRGVCVNWEVPFAGPGTAMGISFNLCPCVHGATAMCPALSSSSLSQLGFSSEPWNTESDSLDSCKDGT